MNTFKSSEEEFSGGIVQEQILEVKLEAQPETETSLEIVVNKLSQVSFQLIQSLLKWIKFASHVEDNIQVLGVTMNFELDKLVEGLSELSILL